MNLNEYAKQYPRGYVSRYMEVGLGLNRVISTGRGDHGGKSYGIYQLSSKMGTLDAFLKFTKARYPGVLSEFASSVSTPSDAAVLALKGDRFDTWWRDVASDIEPYCTKYIISTHTSALLLRIGEYISDLIGAEAYQRLLGDHDAWFELVHSTAVQYGPRTDVLRRAFDTVVNKKATTAWLWEMAHYKADTVQSYFRSSSAQVRRSVENRHRFEAVWLNAVYTGATAKGANMLYDMIGGNEPVGSPGLNDLWEAMAYRLASQQSGYDKARGTIVQVFEQVFPAEMSVGHTSGKIDSTFKAVVIELTRRHLIMG